MGSSVCQLQCRCGRQTSTRELMGSTEVDVGISMRETSPYFRVFLIPDVAHYCSLPVRVPYNSGGKSNETVLKVSRCESFKHVTLKTNNQVSEHKLHMEVRRYFNQAF
ncbi:hypothetical protein J6590_007562 [Homalodisca vitripennis]|nr:hypothetical protein J6590_007562 [Homalodisca vitripennis]